MKIYRYVFVGLAFVVIATETLYIVRLRNTIDALIDLNHDKSIYIDAGCRGHYQGAEELLPGEGEQ